MNILTDTLSDFVTVDGKNYPIFTDFRNWIKFEMIITDRLCPQNQKAVSLLKLCYKQLPPAFDSALKAAMEFYIGKSNIMGLKGSIYNFEFDADYIYAAFYGQYGIDLQKTDMHWWQFKALFGALNNTNKFIKIMEYRNADLSKIKNMDTKAFYRKMKQLYKLPDNRTEEEKDVAMIKSLSCLF